MKNLFLYLLFVVMIVALYGFAFAGISSDEPEGQKIFVTLKCNTCHSINSCSITTKAKKSSDLSSVGKNNNYEKISSYLLKKEKLNDKEHKPAFKGTEKDLETISKWLSTLKSEKK